MVIFALLTETPPFLGYYLTPALSSFFALPYGGFPGVYATLASGLGG